MTEALNNDEKIYRTITNCTICLGPMTSGLATTNCGCVFHYECIAMIMKKMDCCPNCKTA